MTGIRAKIGLACAVTLLVWSGPQRPAIARSADVVIASGTLIHHRLTNALFHVGDLWMQVEPGTEFHRWLLDGADGRIDVILTLQPGRFGDDRAARILSGRLIHGTSPQTSPLTHLYYLRDQALATLGPVLFETNEPAVAGRFNGYDDADVSIVLRTIASVRRSR